MGSINRCMIHTSKAWNKNLRRKKEKRKKKKREV